MSANVLVLEHDPRSGKELGEKLDSEGYKSTVIGSCDLFLETALARIPDLIVLDLDFPEEKAVSVYENLKRSPKLERVPLVVLTSRSPEQAFAAIGRPGSREAHVRKPANAGEIAKHVEKLLASGGTRGAPEDRHHAPEVVPPLLHLEPLQDGHEPELTALDNVLIPGGEQDLMAPGDTAPGDVARSEEPAGSFFCNTRFPHDAAVASTGILVLETDYEVETVLGTSEDPDAALAQAISAKDVPPGTKVAFRLRVRGGSVRDKSGGPPSGQLKSPPLEVTSSGTKPWSAILTPHEKDVELEVDLYCNNAQVARKVRGFTAVPSAADSPAGTIPTPVTPSPAPESGSIAPGALEPAPGVLGTAATLRIDFEPSGNRFNLALEAGALADNQPLLTHSTEKSIVDEAIRQRRRLAELTDQFKPAPSQALGISEPGDAMLRFAQIGASMHRVLFGDPLDPGLERVATALAHAGRDSPARLQIVAGYLPFPWAVLYDGVAYGSGIPETAGDVDPQCFWGARFLIDSPVFGTVGGAPSPVIGRRGSIRVQSCINMRIDDEQTTSAASCQAEIFEKLRRANPAITACPTIETSDAFEAWLRQDDDCDMLYFFCHAHAAETLNDAEGPVDTPPAQQAAIVLDDGKPLSVEEMRGARKRPLGGSPFVFMNACSTARGDPEFQSLFLQLFVDAWGARAFLGTDWKVPTPFADQFSRRVLELFLEEKMTIAEAMSKATKEALDLENPFPLIYAFYGQPQLRIARRGIK